MEILADAEERSACMDLGVLAHLAKMVMHPGKGQEVPMLGQGGAELPAAAAQHEEQHEPKPIAHRMQVLHQPDE